METKNTLWETEEERLAWVAKLQTGVKEGLYSKDPNVVRSAKIAVQAGALLPGTVVPVRKGKV